jgi:hypothetical protein
MQHGKAAYRGDWLYLHERSRPSRRRNDRRPDADDGDQTHARYRGRYRVHYVIQASARMAALTGL